VRLNQERPRHRQRSLAERMRGALDTLRDHGADSEPSEGEAIRHALAALTSIDREVLQLQAWEELSADEIAVVLDISAPAVWKRLQRARERLSRAFRQQTAGEPDPLLAVVRPVRKEADERDRQLRDRLRRADPAAGIDRSPSGPTARRIHDEVRRRVGAAPAAREPSRSRLRRIPAPAPSRVWRRAVALGAVAVVAAIALAVVPDVLSRSGTPAYAIRQLPNGVIVVDWSADSFSPNAGAIAADLREYGVDVQITTIPASPSAVGEVTATFRGEGGSGPPPGFTIGNGGTPEAFTWTIDPTVFRGPVTLTVAVPAREGEHYGISQEVFEPGEILGGLQCALGEPLRAADVAERLPGLGVTAVWNVIDPASVTADGYHETQVDQVPDGDILWGYALDATTVQLTVAPDGVPLSDYPPARLSDVPCTKAQAASWK
jgi:predicted DNA-binding protein (UPF0251 family)